MKIKFLFLALFITVITASCKKDNKDNRSCDRVTAVNGRKLIYDSNGRVSEFTSETAGKATVSYENSNKTVIVNYSSGRQKLQLDNNGFYIKAELYNAAGKMLQSVSIGRNGDEYITDEVIELYKPDGTLDQRVAYNDSNSFDTHGNLTKTVSVRTGFPPDSVEYIYDISRTAVTYISGEGALLFETNPQSKNLLLREKFNGKDRYLYSFTTDSKGRVIYNKCTPLTSGGTGYENNIQYECN